jgi:hypothetical protein
MENEYLAQNRLTSGGDSPKLNEGDVFMADVTNTEGEGVKPAESTPQVAPIPVQEGDSVNNPQQQEAAGGAGNGENGGERPPGPPQPENHRNPDDDENPNIIAKIGDERNRYTETQYRNLWNQGENHRIFWEQLRAVSPHSGYSMDRNLISFLAKLTGEEDSDKPIYYLVNKIVALPLDNESAGYELGLTARGNIDTVFSELKEAVLGASGEDKDVIRGRAERIRSTYEAVSILHNMNKGIVTSGIKEFDRLAEEITPEQQQVLQEVNGAALVMRLFEDEYQRILMNDKTVTTEKNDELRSKHIKHGDDKQPETEEQRQARTIGIIEQKLRDMRDYATQKAAEGHPVDADSTLGKLKGLEDWELGWAFNAGKLLYNVSLRAAEQISLSEIPSGGAAWRSPPQENMVRIMNRVNWIMTRFHKGEARGGVEFVKRVQAHYNELRERNGFGKTGMTNLAGKKIEDYEVASIFNVSGIFSSWRNEGIILEHAPIIDPDTKEKTTIFAYLKRARAEREKVLKGNRKPEEWEKVKDRVKAFDEPEILRSMFLDKDGKLKPEFTNALGVLIRFGDIQGKAKDVDIKGLIEAKAQIREAIWKKIAEDNPLAVAYFLNGMKFKEGHAPFSGKKLDDFKAFADTDNGRLNTDKNPVWASLREKLIIAREVRMAKSAKGGVAEDIALDKILETMEGENKLNGDEQKFLDEIRGYGKDVAKDLAAVRLPFNPFMTDVIFEQVDYAQAGNQYYRRRVGDIGAINASYEALEKIVGNPAGISREDTMKALQEAIVALDGPNGWESGTDSVMPFFMSVLDFWEAGGQYRDLEGNGGGIRSWFAKDNLIKPFIKQLQLPDSLAQQYGGVKAIAYDEFALREVINEAFQMGITRKTQRDAKGLLQWTDTDDFLKKKKGVKMGGWLMAVFRDLFLKAFVAGFAIQIVRESRKEQK